MVEYRNIMEEEYIETISSLVILPREIFVYIGVKTDVIFGIGLKN